MEIYVHTKVIPRAGPSRRMALGPPPYFLTCKWVKQLKGRVKLGTVMFLMSGRLVPPPPPTDQSHSL